MHWLLTITTDQMPGDKIEATGKREDLSLIAAMFIDAGTRNSDLADLIGDRLNTETVSESVGGIHYNLEQI